MLKNSVKKCFAVLTVFGQASLAAPFALAQHPAFTVTSLAKRGDITTDGIRLYESAQSAGVIGGAHSLNNKGEALVMAPLPFGCGFGLLLASGSRITRAIDNCHDTRAGAVTELINGNLNEAAQVVAHGFIGFYPDALEFVSLVTDGKISDLLATGDKIPGGSLGRFFGEPTINNKGEIAFSAFFNDEAGQVSNGVFVFSNGQLRKIVADSDKDSTGLFKLIVEGLAKAWINDNGVVLFQAADPHNFTGPYTRGLFVTVPSGIQKVVVVGDTMPTGGVVSGELSIPVGSLNERADVVFSARLTGGSSESAIFLHTGGKISKLIGTGDPSPIGGHFSSLEANGFFPVFVPGQLVTPVINNVGAVAFGAGVKGGSNRGGIFLASPKAIVKVVGTGDRLPTGEKIREITSYAVNDLGQVTFFAYGDRAQTSPVGLYLATPVRPVIGATSLKKLQDAFVLKVDGSWFINNDSVIEINGQALATEYPAGFQEDGGTTTRLVSRDARLAQLLPQGQPLHMTVFNSLTNIRSGPVTFSR